MKTTQEAPHSSIMDDGNLSNPPLNWTLYELAKQHFCTMPSTSVRVRSEHLWFVKYDASRTANVPTKQSPAPTVSRTTTFGHCTRHRYTSGSAKTPTPVFIPTNAPLPPSVMITTMSFCTESSRSIMTLNCPGMPK